MNKSSKFRRIIASFFLTIFLPTLMPNSLYASNNGPVSPEAASFEPVDATDMVNLTSGDMSYALPVLNVPSPEGGYPLALAYHAGIALDQEASWVGLGWNLNPGAINRSVSGVPDDWFQNNTNTIAYFAGGENTSYSGSVSVGFGQNASVGLYASYSENKTFGGTTSYSFDAGVQGLGGSIGTDGVGYSFGTKIGNSPLSAGIGINQSFKDGSTTVGLSVGGGGRSGGQNVGPSGSTGISWNSQHGFFASVGTGGFSLSGNNNNGSMYSFNGQRYSASIQIYAVTIGFGFSKTRYWYFDKNYTKYSGSLYAGDVTNLADDLFPQNTSFDSYSSIYKLNSDGQIESDALSYIAYDNYSISGQGISGSMKPGIYEQGSLLGSSMAKTKNNAVISYKIGTNQRFSKKINTPNNDIHFYMDNENSSFLKSTSGDWTPYVTLPTSAENYSTGNPIMDGLEKDLYMDGIAYNGYNASSKRKRTGTVIETFTNEEINNNPNLIIKPENFSRVGKPNKGIGAYKITSVDGKTYHYSIPVYQKQKFYKRTDVNKDYSNEYLEQQQLEPYATHWLLTAVTGPDYYDTNQNNMIDENDYGYWAAFDYGKWSDGFAWATPEKYFEKEKSYEWGVKEIYYLDKIKTRTHTALFVKSERKDDLSYKTKIGQSIGDMHWDSSTSRSFVTDKNGNWHVNGIYENHSNLGVYNPAYVFPDAKFGKYIEFNYHRSLKLDKVLLLKNSDLNALNVSKSTGNQTSNFVGNIHFKEEVTSYNVNGQTLGTSESQYNDTWSGEFYNSVIDKNDISNLVDDKAIKTVKFNYDSTKPLAKKSRNSEESEKGRLTLKSVSFLGKDATETTPPFVFDYINNLDYDKTKEDNWGYYKNNPMMWSLNSIQTPLGSRINIQYESDDIDKEAVPGKRGFDSNLQFIFYQYGDKVRIQVENEYNSNAVNFNNFFTAGQTTSLDLWASLKHDYNDWGCESRKGAVDINSQSVNVVSVTNGSVVLEFPSYAIYDENGGFGWMSNKVIGLINHPDMIIESSDRGAWGEPPGCTNVTDRLVLTYKLSGNKAELTSSDKNSGGIRVKEINIYEDNLLKSKEKYTYNVPGFAEDKTSPQYKSSGVTSYVPQRYFKEIKYRSELPPPYVSYEYVTVKKMSSANEVLTSEVYNFEVLSQNNDFTEDNLNIANVLKINKSQQANVNNIHFSKYKIEDRTSKLGKLKSKKTYNDKNHLLAVYENNYSNYATAYGLGVSEDTYNTYKTVSYGGGNVNYRVSNTSKTIYPSILKSTAVTQGNYKNVISNDKYDFLTGQVLETTKISSNGQSFKTKTVPAYYKYAGMGSKVDDVNNANMLSQTAVEYSYILDNTTWKETGVGITTWNNIWTYQDVAGDSQTPTATKEKIWRKHKTYTWNGVVDMNGIFINYDTTSGKDDGFDWTIGVGSQPSQWKQTSEVTKYNHFSLPLEVKDINGNKAATKTDVFNEKVETSGNAAYNEMYYASAENIKDYYWLAPEVRIQDADRDLTYAHTGKYSVATTNNSQFGVYMRNGHKPGKYKISVWVHKNNYQKARLHWYNNDPANTFNFNGEKYFAGDWVLLTHYTDVHYMNNSNAYWYVNSEDSSTVYYDDLMIRPIVSSITGYVYNERDELSFIIGNNGLASKFEYDAAGRLEKTSVEVIDNPNAGLTGGFKLKTVSKINFKNL